MILVTHLNKMPLWVTLPPHSKKVFGSIPWSDIICVYFLWELRVSHTGEVNYSFYLECKPKSGKHGIKIQINKYIVNKMHILKHSTF